MRVAAVDVEVKRGDVLTVKCEDWRGLNGFACAIKGAKEGRSLATNVQGAWEQYEPTTLNKWSDPQGIRSTSPIRPGSNRDMGHKVSEQSGIPTEPIWGNGTTCYLILKIR